MAYRLLVVSERGQQRFVLHDGENVVGSDLSCAIHVPHPSVSQRHAALDVTGAKRLLFGTDSSFFPRGWQPAACATW